MNFKHSLFPTVMASAARWLGLALLLALLGACGTLTKPSSTPMASYYALESAPRVAAAPAAMPAPARAGATATVVVTNPHAAAGYDSQRIIYVREPHKLEYFANSEWIDAPQRMLGPLVATALQDSGAFAAVVQTPGAPVGDMRLDTEIIRLHQDFSTSPSRVRFTLRAWLLADRSRRVMAWREFDQVVPAASDDPYGGVIAANRAVQAALAELATFFAEAARMPVPLK